MSNVTFDAAPTLSAPLSDASATGAPVIVIFGASGDLTRRKLVPALHSLLCEGLLPGTTRVVGVGRAPLTDDEFRDQLYEGIRENARISPDSCKLWPHFSQRYTFLSGDYGDPDTYWRLSQLLAEARHEGAAYAGCLYYLATPPELAPLIIAHLGRSGLNHVEGGWTRIVLEKPYGHDLESARELNRQVHSVFDEDQVYRIDHYLGKETVQNILTFRFGNAIFEPLWNRNYVAQVQITAAEDIGIGNRGPYYDRAGVVRDMFQSHLLQLLALTAIEPPVAFNAQALRDEKVKVLTAVRPLHLDDALVGQYRGYRQEPGVAPDSTTPTFLCARLGIENWRWQGVPFYVRTGKSLASKLTTITLQFRQVPHLLFPEPNELSPNRLCLCIQPNEGIRLSFQTKLPGAGMRSSTVEMQFSYSSRFGERVLPDAYERLLLDAVQGDASLFARSDEIERAWTLADPILKELEQQRQQPPAFYEPGTWGPSEAAAFIAPSGCDWFADSTSQQPEGLTVVPKAI